MCTCCRRDDPHAIRKSFAAPEKSSPPVRLGEDLRAALKRDAPIGDRRMTDRNTKQAGAHGLKAYALALGVSGAAMMLAAGPVMAQAPEASRRATRDFDIAAQPLATAIAAYGRQAGLQVTAQSDVTDGVQAQAVRGQFSTTDALSRLLEGTGVTWRIDGGVVVLSRAPRGDGA